MASDHPCEASDSIHATALVVGETGVLITGPSGTGKSRLAMELLQAARRGGRFAVLIGDDRVTIRRIGRRLIAIAPPNIGGLIELRGSGIMKGAYLPRAVMHLGVAVGDAGPDQRLPRVDACCEPLPGIVLPLLHLVPGHLHDPLEAVDAFLRRRWIG